MSQREERIWNDLAKSPAQWMASAESLRLAAEALWTDLTARRDIEKLNQKDIVPVYFLLMGLAIENIVKGIAIAKAPDHFFPNGKFSWGQKGHKSKSILENEKIGIHLNESEADMLNHLTEHVVWLGKYPVPLRPDDLKLYHLLIISIEDQPKAVAMYETLHSHLIEAMRRES